MRRKSMAVILAVLMILMGMPIGYAVTYKTATVVEVTGTVSILKAGGEKAFAPEVSTVLEHGDRIITGKKSSIALKINDDKYVKVGEKTYMSLSELMSEAESGGDSTNIKLFSGKVWASLSKPLGGDDSFEIETPTAVMGAKGTKFYVKYSNAVTGDAEEQGETELVVLEGRVSMKTSLFGSERTDEVELYANANEAVTLNPKLVQGISDALKALIDGGQKIEDINIQEVVAGVAKAKQIGAVDLDLFVLEIIAETPDEYEPALIDELDALIQQKQNEQPQGEDEGEGIDGIIYEGMDDSNEAQAPAEAPSGGSDGGGSGGGGSNGGGSAESISLLSVKAVDSNQNDGIADHLIVTFDKPVDDSTFVVNSPITFSSQAGLGTVDTSEISYDAIEGYENTVDDESIVLKINTNGMSMNTQPTGLFSISNSGIIKGMNGAALGTVSGISVQDGVAPQILGTEIFLDGDAGSQFVKMTFSEPLSSYGPDFWQNTRVVSNMGMAYSEGIELYFGQSSFTGSDIKAIKLTRPTVEGLVGMAANGYESMRFKFDPDTEIQLTDTSGNTSILDENLQVTSYKADTKRGKVSSVSVTGEGTTTATVKITFSDYLKSSNLQAYLEAIEDKVIVENGSAIIDSKFFENQYYDKISLTVVFTLEEPLSDITEFSVDLDGLYDLSENPMVMTNEDVIRSKFGIVHENGFWQANSPYIKLLSAKTMDLDKNGKVDAVELTFNEAVEDSSYADSGLTITSSKIGLTDVMTGQLATDVSGDELYDEKIYLTVTEYVYNTDAIGSVNVPDVGMIRGFSGRYLNAETDVQLTDGADPVMVGSSIDLSQPYDEKYVKMVFSEALDETSSLDLSQIKLTGTGAFASSTFDIEGTDTSIAGNEVTISGFPMTTISESESTYVSMMANYLYEMEDAHLRIEGDMGLKSESGESYLPMGEIGGPFETPTMDSVVRTRGVEVSSVVFGDNNKEIIVTFDDYIETFNAIEYSIIVPFVYNTDETYEVEAAFGADHKSLILTAEEPPVTEDELILSGVKGITNCYANEYQGGFESEEIILHYDGTKWTVE